MKKAFYFLCALAFVFLGCANAERVKDNAVSGEQSVISYEDSDEVFFNPDIGFYCAVEVPVGKSQNYNVNFPNHSKFFNVKNPFYDLDAKTNEAKFKLVHLKIDISRYSDSNKFDSSNEYKSNGSIQGNPDAFTSEKLADLKNILSDLRTYDETAIVRFCYDAGYDGHGQDGTQIEPTDFKKILDHIKVICPALKDYTDVITAIECGLIGPWGEMNSTPYTKAMSANEYNKYASTYGLNKITSSTSVECGYIIILMKAYLDELWNNGVNVPLLVRQPKFLSLFLEACPSLSPSEKNMLGIFNDGYLGTDSDTGTFSNFETRVQQDIPFMADSTNHTPYGGEICDSTSKTPLWEDKLDYAVEEMSTVHLSFLNIGWNYNVLNWSDKDDHTWSYEYKKNNQNLIRTMNKSNKVSAYGNKKLFQVLLRYMGYRYLITQSNLSYYEESKKLEVELEIQNKGFANMPYHRSKNLTAYLVSSSGNKTKIPVNGENFTGQSSLSFNFALPADLENGDYTVYIKFANKDGHYPVQFANKNIWNTELSANKVGVFTKSE